jgi:hypothetical protein
MTVNGLKSVPAPRRPSQDAILRSYTTPHHNSTPPQHTSTPASRSSRPSSRKNSYINNTSDKDTIVNARPPQPTRSTQTRVQTRVSFSRIEGFMDQPEEGDGGWTRQNLDSPHHGVRRYSREFDLTAS